MTSEAAGWVAATASVRGASHERSGKPNQDAVRVIEVAGPTPGLVAAVADGHGGDRYVRSDVGSRLAVEVACSVGRRVLETLGPGPSAAAAESHLAGDAARSILDHWRRRVLDDVDQRPFSAAEEERSGGSLGSDPLIAYGCTLLLAVVAPSWVGLLQIGDGDATVVRGATAASPVPGDDRLVGGETTSLCLPTAVADARIAVLGEPLPDMIILTSDGYANSFASPTWRSEVGVDLRDHVNRIGIDEVEKRLPTWLGDSAVAAGDDVSMALIHRVVSSSSPVPVVEPSKQRPGPWRVISLVAVAALLGVGAGWLVADARGSDRVESADSPVVVESTTSTTTTTTLPPSGVASTVPRVTVATTTTAPDTASPEDTTVTLGAADVVYFLGGDTDGVVLVLDPSSPTTPSARSLGWVAMGDREPGVLSPPWNVDLEAEAVFFNGVSRGPALAAFGSPWDPYVWVVEPDRRTLAAYNAKTGRLEGRSPITEIHQSAGLGGVAQSSPPTDSVPDSTLGSENSLTPESPNATEKP